MKTLISGAAMLCAMSLPALALAAPASPLPGVKCVPYQQAIAQIEDAGGEILGERPTPFTRNGTALYFTTQRVVMAAGVAGVHTCVFLPAAALGHLGFDPAVL
jgi:hypothetical protein